MSFKTSQALFFVKSALFIALSAIFYIFYLTEIIKKYADGYTYFLTYQKTMETITPPFLTLCPAPRAKLSILEKYNMSFGSLNEINKKEIETLASLNKTVEDLFRETTFKLNVDFYIFVVFWYYESHNGWIQYRNKLSEGTDNFLKVGTNIHEKC